MPLFSKYYTSTATERLLRVCTIFMSNLSYEQKLAGLELLLREHEFQPKQHRKQVILVVFTTDVN